ncbi:MAG TPA: ferrochelatase [Saprospiraceae bacterium]|nr:ferrochelatase [Saprospiraceae bacterium]HMQ82106.1 ferrochelatase [Saprospiraceae bacterium]
MAATGKKGVLLVNLGTPDAPTRSAVYRYLKQFLLDARVVDYPWLARNLLVRGIIAPFRSGKSAKLYQQLWTPEGSPLKVYGERLARGVQQALGDEYAVELAMRYQNPSIESAIQRLLKQGVGSITVFPLFPQYASATTGSVHEAVMQVLSQEESIPDVHLINSYCDHPAMIDIFTDNARQFDLNSYDFVLFSYHGLPQRQLRKADRSGSHCLQREGCCHNLGQANQFCYSAQCQATTRAIVSKLGLEAGKYTTSFQSRLGPELWAQPYTSTILEEQARKGAKRILVFSPAFVADCLETLIEIGHEYQEEFEKMGGEKVDLVPSLNDDPRWIQAVAAMLR